MKNVYNSSRIFNILFGVIVISYIVTVTYMFSNLYRESYAGLESSIDVLEESTGDRLRTIDKMYYALELSLDEQLEDALELMNEAYNSGTLTDEYMQELRDNNPHMHFFVINEEHVITKSTLEADLGLDFSFAPLFCDYLDEIRANNAYTKERVSLSTVTSDINKYGYMGSKDGKVVLEVSHDMKNYEEFLEKDSLSSLSSSAIESLPYIVYLDIYNYFGKSANTGLNITEVASEEVLSHYHKAEESGGTVVYKTQVDDHIETTRFIPYVIHNFNDQDSVYTITITYTDHYVRQSLVRSLTSTLLYLGIIVLFFVAYYLYVNKRLVKPLLTNLETNEKGYLATVETLANALEAKDNYTRGHSERVSKLSIMFGEYLGLDDYQMTVLQRGSLLHDIGKIGINDSVLNKKGRFNDEEYALIKEHPTIGYNILKEMEFLGEANKVILYHHERVDGNGYPERLKENDIPYLAKLLAITDAFDAMTSKRVYKDSYMKVSEAIEELKRCGGTQFDMELVILFEQAYEKKYGYDIDCYAEDLEV